MVKKSLFAGVWPVGHLQIAATELSSMQLRTNPVGCRVENSETGGPQDY